MSDCYPFPPLLPPLTEVLRPAAQPMPLATAASFLQLSCGPHPPVSPSLVDCIFLWQPDLQRSLNLHSLSGDSFKFPCIWTSPVVQWLKISLPMQGTQAQSLVQDDTGWLNPCTTAEPLCHSYWSLCTLEHMLFNKRSHCNEKSTHHSQRVSHYFPQLEKACTQQQRPSPAKNKQINKK